MTATRIQEKNKRRSVTPMDAICVGLARFILT
jgi:hypothetical protein